MVTFSGPPSSATRNKPISPELKAVLEAAALASGIDKINIVSGGQDAKGEGTRRTGSTRHDRGRAADIELFINGSILTFSDQFAPPAIISFVTTAARTGATGIGAGEQYMGVHRIHVGFGLSAGDRTRVTWGAAERSVNSPQWLRDAARAGRATWSTGEAPASPLATSIGHYVVMARGGLKLRGGPGVEFASDRTLPLGTDLDVLDFGGTDLAWARVSLSGDEVADGYVFASFLSPAAAASDEEEPAEATA